MRRLRNYWKIEAANVIILPGAAWYLSVERGQPLGWVAGVALLPAMLLLVAGAAYWRAKLRRAADGIAADAVVRRQARLKLPLLALAIVGAAAAAAAWLAPALAASEWDRWVATLAAALGLAEYANYYRVQLQHFDHGADFRRLLSGRGLRRAHLRRDIDALARRVRPQ